MSAFAEAYQQMLGGSLTGQESISMFLKDMGDGKIKSSEIMPYAGKILSKRAESKVGIMKKSSMAEQERFANVKDDMTQKFGTAGGEEGYAKFWWSLTRAMGESTEEMEFFGRAFDKVMYGFSKFVLIPQSIKRMFQGRDSLIRDWFDDSFGKVETDDLIASFKKLASESVVSFDIIKGGWVALAATLKSEGVAPNFAAMATDISNYLSLTMKAIQIATITDPKEKLKAIEEAGIISTNLAKGTGVEGTDFNKMWRGVDQTLGYRIGGDYREGEVEAVKERFIDKNGNLKNLDSATWLEKKILSEQISAGVGETIPFNTLKVATRQGVTTPEGLLDFHNKTKSVGGFFNRITSGLDQATHSKVYGEASLVGGEDADKAKALLSRQFNGVENLDFKEVMSGYWKGNDGTKTVTPEKLIEYILNNYNDTVLDRKLTPMGNPLIEDPSIDAILNSDQYIEKIISGINGSRPNEIVVNNNFQISEAGDAQGTADKVVKVVTEQISSLLQASMLPYANAV